MPRWDPFLFCPWSMLGHSCLSSTQVYTKVSHQGLKDVHRQSHEQNGETIPHKAMEDWLESWGEDKETVCPTIK